MSLSSGGWTTHTPPPEPSSSIPGYGASQSGCHTVLMSVRVSVCHSGIRPLCLPGASDESLRLQLSMDPGKSGDFRLTLRDTSGTTGRSVSIAEFDLRSVNYEVKSPKCHELSLASPPRDRISFNFRCEQEAQEWATVVMSSLREAHRVSDSLPTDDGQLPLKASDMPSSATLPRTEEMCAELTLAIQSGDIQAASKYAATLARQQAALKIHPSVKSYEDAEVSLAVVVEDSSSSCCVTVKVLPHLTIATLKQQVFLEYGFHPRVQRWVIGQCLCADQRSLASYGVRRDGDTAFLYLLSARHARLTRQLLQQDQESALLAPQPPHGPPGNGPSTSQDWRGYNTLPPRPSHCSMGSNGAGAERLNISEIKDLINLEMPQLGEALSPKKSVHQGWACPSCTYINKPTRPGCEICSTDRPDSYTVPGSYTPDPLELRRIQQEKEAVRQYQQEKGRREELRAAGPQNSSLLGNLDQDY
ncbi:hypothetical protein UPYG_G00072770 [Umbra pygmaea]|uniref:Heme-oxidized IRP2 ubiquitin transferase 1 homolog n=1 Tax=Umbra pygmaea TaxID=75934 RepID=A0ABD0XEY1_UMBPY